MKRIWVECIKELAQIRRDRVTVLLAYLLPLITLLIYGFAIKLEAKAIPLGVQDFNLSPYSRTYIERLVATNRFKLISRSSNASTDDILGHSIGKVDLVIPPDFESRIKSGKTSTVQVLIDGTDVNNARIIENSIRATTDFFLGSMDLQPVPTRLVASERLLFNPGRKESLYIVPGVYGVILAIYPSLLAAIAMVREKEQGTIVQIYASSLSAVELLLGKGLAYCLVGLSEAFFIMSLGSLFFGIWFVGEPTLLLIGTLIFLTTNVQLGLFIGLKAKTQGAAVQGIVSLSYLMAYLFSGFIYPLKNIPFPLSLISYLVPARYYIELCRDAFVRGTGWAGFWFIPVILALLGLPIFTAAWRELRSMQLPE